MSRGVRESGTLRLIGSAAYAYSVTYNNVADGYRVKSSAKPSSCVTRTVTLRSG